MKEYILIGEADGGICGHAVLTWGVGADRDSSSEPDEAWESEIKKIPSEKLFVPDGAEQSERTSGGAESLCAGGCTVKEQHWCALQISLAISLETSAGACLVLQTLSLSKAGSCFSPGKVSRFHIQRHVLLRLASQGVWRAAVRCLLQQCQRSR